jgi:hypothetical protein
VDAGVAVAVYAEEQTYLFVGGKPGIDETTFWIALEGDHERFVVGSAGCIPAEGRSTPGTRAHLRLEPKGSGR